MWDPQFGGNHNFQRKGQNHAMACPLLPSGVCYLRQARQEAGPAGGAAADRGEGILEDQAPLGQSIQVWGLYDCVVIHATLKTTIIRCHRKEEHKSRGEIYSCSL